MPVDGIGEPVVWRYQKLQSKTGAAATNANASVRPQGRPCPAEDRSIRQMSRSASRPASGNRSGRKVAVNPQRNAAGNQPRRSPDAKQSIHVIDARAHEVSRPLMQ